MFFIYIIIKNLLYVECGFKKRSFQIKTLYVKKNSTFSAAVIILKF